MTEMEEKVKIQDWVDEKFKDKLTGRNIQQLYLKSDLVDSIYEYSQVRFNEFAKLKSLIEKKHVGDSEFWKRVWHSIWRNEELEIENGKLEGKLADLQSEYVELENFHNNEVNKLKEQIEKMKGCFNCKYQNKFVESKCGECEDYYSKWEIKEND